MARFMPTNLAISGVTFDLPAKAHSLIYKDEVGNVSTSSVIKERKRVLFRMMSSKFN